MVLKRSLKLTFSLLLFFRFLFFYGFSSLSDLNKHSKRIRSETFDLTDMSLVSSTILQKEKKKGSRRLKLTLPSLPVRFLFPSLPSPFLQRRLRSSSLRLHVPWEVLLVICQQSDGSTLRNLCLVSFGMVELAGPLLYEDVEIKTLERIYLFLFIVSR